MNDSICAAAWARKDVKASSLSKEGVKLAGFHVSG